MSRHGKIQVVYTKSGLTRYELEIWHDELGKYQLIRGDSTAAVEQRALSRMAQWDKAWEREQRTLTNQEKTMLAAEKTQEAQAALEALGSILVETLKVNDAIDWEKLKITDEYSVARPSQPTISKAPDSADPKYQPQLGFLDKLVQSRKEERVQTATARYETDLQEWTRVKENAENTYAMQLAQWERKRNEFNEDRDSHNAEIESKREAYFQGDTSACLSYVDMVLSRSSYPEYFPQTYELDLNPESKTLVIDYQLPDVASMPTVREVKYNQSKGVFSESTISAAQLNRLYDDVLYQVALRTIHEVFEADVIDAIESVVFNGYVTSTDPATGREKTACVISVQAKKDEFQEINLANVDPKACFKSLKGVGSSKLHSLTPIAPILVIDREDKRFVDSYAVAGDLDETVNLAAMDWEDFEHLVREVFEKEFASSGGEVKVTQASRDGGIDAVAFDPDPIRGGKIVIQAKRYTNTVGVSAVRDLYGSVMNEGATKGILVTTADYGPDAYEFARGKPLTLLTGNNLLHLLEKHGHRAKIDLREAKRMLNESK